MPRNATPDRHSSRRDRSKEPADVILEATMHVLKQVGFRETTTERIATRAGMSIGALHQYFPNKIALYEALMMRYFELRANAAYSLAHRLTSAPAKEFPELMAGVLLTAERYDPQLSDLLHQIAAAHPSVAAVEMEHWRMLEMAVGTLLRKRHGTAGFRADLNPELAATVLTRAVTGLTRRTLEMDPALISSDAFAAELEQMIRGYLLAS
jgi:AcrR family transcriptional regulator